ncbi:hypothetical protein JF544_03395 [Halobacillus kuroshimensis]|uniref:Uncharacterized protein n=1 Tax=Halobacillus kuroshimensis TaxID=302481 RepID=A0ABS3DSE2_9BACI|nr:hypothetical protein [Halobacillus kuroshimensis]MBN8234273.1 hypothetical protein [Halobacillus kuroshimensis]
MTQPIQTPASGRIIHPVVLAHLISTGSFQTFENSRHRRPYTEFAGSSLPSDPAEWSELLKAMEEQVVSTFLCDDHNCVIE